MCPFSWLKFRKNIFFEGQPLIQTIVPHKQNSEKVLKNHFHQSHYKKYWRLLYLSEGPALAFEAALGRQGHTCPRRGTVEHNDDNQLRKDKKPEKHVSLSEFIQWSWNMQLRHIPRGCSGEEAGVLSVLQKVQGTIPPSSSKPAWSASGKSWFWFWFWLPLRWPLEGKGFWQN